MRDKDRKWVAEELKEYNREIGKQLRDIQVAVAGLHGSINGLQHLIGEPKAHPFDGYSTDELIAMMQQGIIGKQDLIDYVKQGVSR